MVFEIFSFVKNDNWFAISEDTRTTFELLHDLPHVGELSFSIKVHSSVLEFNAIIVSEGSVTLTAETLENGVS